MRFRSTRDTMARRAASFFRPPKSCTRRASRVWRTRRQARRLRVWNRRLRQARRPCQRAWSGTCRKPTLTTRKASPMEGRRALSATRATPARRPAIHRVGAMPATAGGTFPTLPISTPWVVLTTLQSLRNRRHLAISTAEFGTPPTSTTTTMRPSPTRSTGRRLRRTETFTRWIPSAARVTKRWPRDACGWASTRCTM